MPKTIDKPLFVFSHVQKAGGTTVEAVMRRNFGIRHMLVNPRRGWIYRESDLRADLRLNPMTRSLCSHWFRPFVEFGKWEERLIWYTMLREPISRYLSHFQHHVEKMGSTQTFEQWLRKPIQKNWQTQLFAGEQDLEAAKQILATRYRSVGMLERFEESLLLLRDRLGLPGLALAYGRPHNAARSRGMREMLQEQVERHRDAILENNQLDLELYEFVAGELLPGQIREYGEDRMRSDLAAEFSGFAPGPRDWLREKSNVLFRRSVYLPVARLRSTLARLRNVPDVRR